MSHGRLGPILDAALNNLRVMRTKLVANEPLTRVTSNEVLDAFIEAGLGRMATGAAIGAGYAFLSGGSMIEGAKQGAFWGGAWGTYSRMNAIRAARAGALGLDTRGFGGGFRASAQMRRMTSQDLTSRLDETENWLRAQFGELGRLQEAMASAQTEAALRNAMGEYQRLASQVAARLGDADIADRFRAEVSNTIAEQLRRFQQSV